MAVILDKNDRYVNISDFLKIRFFFFEITQIVAESTRTGTLKNLNVYTSFDLATLC